MEKIVHVNTMRLFGFDKDEEGQLRVNPQKCGRATRGSAWCSGI